MLMYYHWQPTMCPDDIKAPHAEWFYGNWSRSNRHQTCMFCLTFMEDFMNECSKTKQANMNDFHADTKRR